MNQKSNKQFQNADIRMKEAMLELMNTMPFHKITVRLICDRAGVNRSTFYAHYADIYDMVEQLETNLRKKLMNNYPVSEHIIPLSMESFITFLKFIREHRDFYRVVLKARREFPLRQGAKQLFEQIVRPLCQKAGISSESEMMFYFVGFQAAFTMILKRWVEQDCIESEEKIAQILRNIIPSVWM